MKIVMTKNLFIVFLLLLCGTAVLGQVKKNQEEPEVHLKKNEKQWNLKGNWKFIEADSAAFANPNFDDSAWEEQENNSFKLFNHKKVIWVRKNFTVDSSFLGKSLALNFVEMGDYEMFLNGKRISYNKTLPDESGSLPSIKRNKTYFFPIESLDPNVIAIRSIPRVQKVDEDLFGLSGIFDIELSTVEQNAKNQEENFRENNLLMMICGMFLSLGIVHLLIFILYRKEVYNLFFSLYNFSLSSIAYLSVQYKELDKSWDISTLNYLMFASVCIFGLSLTGFVNTLFGKSKSRFWILMVLPILFILLFPISKEYAILSIAGLSIYLFFVIIESNVLIIRGMLRKERSAFIVGGGILAFVGFFVFSIIFKIFGVSSTEFGETFFKYYSLFVVVCFPVSISAYLAWQFASTNFKLTKKLEEVSALSELSIQQELEKQYILQNQNILLEEQVNERTQELQIEKKKSEDLLLNILPVEVAEELKEKGHTEAKFFDEVSVLFTDFVSFTQNSERLGAETMLKELNDCFTAFDMIMEKHDLEKIKTIGDAYMAVCGLPHPLEDHAQRTVAAAMDILEFIEKRKIEHPNALDIRIGVHSGSIVAGIVGVKKFAYDIWGDTVNTASRMEQNSEKGRVNISETTYNKVKERYQCEARGKIEVKGKGELAMYFVQSKYSN